MSKSSRSALSRKAIKKVHNGSRESTQKKVIKWGNGKLVFLSHKKVPLKKGKG